MTSVPEPTDPVRLHFEGLGGIPLAADRRGAPDAPPVVFLHGGGQTRYSWGGTAGEVAAKGWQAITLDARGHGESGWSEEGDYRLTAFAIDVQRVLELLPDGPILVGASLGGLTSILLAGELAPGITRGVVLVDIIPDMEQKGADRIQAFRPPACRMRPAISTASRAFQSAASSALDAKRFARTVSSRIAASCRLSMVRTLLSSGPNRSSPQENTSSPIQPAICLRRLVLPDPLVPTRKVG